MRLKTLGLVLTAAAVSACGSDDEPNTSADTAVDAATDSSTADAGDDATSDAATDTAVPDTAAPDVGIDTAEPFDCDAVGGTHVEQVSGTIVDDQGTPVEGAKAQVCIRGAGGGALVCLRPGDTDANGGFNVVVPAINQCMEQITLRSLVPAGRFATTYCHIPLEGAQPQMTVDTPFVLFGTEAPTSLPDRGDGESTVTVVFADGLEVDVLPASLGGIASDYDRLAAARIDPTSEGLCFLHGDDVPDRLYAFLPEQDVINDAFDVRIPNSDDLAAGTSVELWVLGGLATTVEDGDDVLEAEWEQYGTATVDADGAFISVPRGFQTFNWFGYRVAAN